MSLLAINTFICSVISCLEVSSRGYLVTNNVAVVFENWFTNDQKKKQELGGKSF